mmetsp:Transcript_9604/g.15528  ORF Transcript_9604/g.15528 Transcript_9604/m.15528 type:complete len:226 (+) Transcript_9604:1641-2318(+)
MNYRKPCVYSSAPCRYRRKHVPGNGARRRSKRGRVSLDNCRCGNCRPRHNIYRSRSHRSACQSMVFRLQVLGIAGAPYLVRKPFRYTFQPACSMFHCPALPGRSCDWRTLRLRPPKLARNFRSEYRTTRISQRCKVLWDRNICPCRCFQLSISKSRNTLWNDSQSRHASHAGTCKLCTTHHRHNTLCKTALCKLHLRSTTRARYGDAGTHLDTHTSCTFQPRCSI